MLQTVSWWSSYCCSVGTHSWVTYALWLTSSLISWNNACILLLLGWYKSNWDSKVIVVGVKIIVADFCTNCNYYFAPTAIAVLHQLQLLFCKNCNYFCISHNNFLTSITFAQISITLAPTAITLTFVPTTIIFKPQLLLHQLQWICTSHNYFCTNLIFQRDSLLSVDQVSVFQGTFWTEQGWSSNCLEDRRLSQSPCLIHHAVSEGLPRWLSGRESTFQCRRCRFDPWVRKIPWRRKWLPTPVFLPGKCSCRAQRSR